VFNIILVGVIPSLLNQFFIGYHVILHTLYEITTLSGGIGFQAKNEKKKNVLIVRVNVLNIWQFCIVRIYHSDQDDDDDDIGQDGHCGNDVDDDEL